MRQCGTRGAGRSKTGRGEEERGSEKHQKIGEGRKGDGIEVLRGREQNSLHFKQLEKLRRSVGCFTEEG